MNIKSLKHLGNLIFNPTSKDQDSNTSRSSRATRSGAPKNGPLNGLQNRRTPDTPASRPQTRAESPAKHATPEDGPLYTPREDRPLYTPKKDKPLYTPKSHRHAQASTAASKPHQTYAQMREAGLKYLNNVGDEPQYTRRSPSPTNRGQASTAASEHTPTYTQMREAGLKYLDKVGDEPLYTGSTSPRRQRK